MRPGSSLEFLIYDASIKARESRVDFALYLMKNIAEQHPFLEGNKRTAYVTGKVLLFNSGYLLCLNENRAAKYMKNLAKRKERDIPRKFKELKLWILLSCEKVPLQLYEKGFSIDQYTLNKYLKRESVTVRNKIRKYISILHLKVKHEEK